MTIYELIKDYQNRRRLKEILKVFFEEEFGYFISKINLHPHLPFRRRLQARIAREKAINHPLRLRRAFERLGPTFIKFGQLLSLRSDLIPSEFIAEFEKMQDHVPPFSYSTARRIIENEFKKPLNQLFTYFPKKPIASASIAQVYKARLGHHWVAVKVQRPNIEKIIKSDIEIMYKLAELLEQHFPLLQEANLKGIIHEFEKWTIKELNFCIEAHYAERIAENFKGSKLLKVPQIYSQLTTNKVLTMEFLDGIPLHDIQQIKKKKIDLKKVIRNGYYVALKQVFVDGFFHADPHPGNILVLKDGKIGLIDFGILGHFDKKLKRYALDIFQTFVDNNPDKATDIILRMNPSSDIDREAFRKDVRDIFEQLYFSSPKDLLIGQFIKETLNTAYQHHLEIPTDFVLYGKTIATIEGLALRYQPDFDFTQETKAIFKQLLDYRFFAKEVLDRTRTKVSEYQDLVERFPETAKEILERARQFKLNLDIEDADVKNLTLEMERSSGNLAVGLIIAALIIGSSSILQTDRLAFLSTSGFILAGLLSLWLIRRTVFVKIKFSR